MLQGSKIYSIFTGKCPVCHKGAMYKNKNPYNFSEALKMYEHCTHCGLKYKIEPSFFFGAMYVSYGLGVAIAVAAFIIAYFFIGMDRLSTFIVIAVTLTALLPIILRLSRNIWINLFLTYDPKKAKNN